MRRRGGSNCSRARWSVGARRRLKRPLATQKNALGCDDLKFDRKKRDSLRLSAMKFISVMTGLSGN
jgi:hypothetical protein